MIKPTANALKKMFCTFLGADAVVDSNGKFVRMEHNPVSRALSAELRNSGTSAWIEFMKTVEKQNDHNLKG